MQPPEDAAFYSLLRDSLARLPAASFERDLQANIPRLFFEAARPFSGPRPGYVRKGEAFHLQDMKPLDKALFWNGTQLGVSDYPGRALAWGHEFAAVAEKVAVMAERTGARTVLELGAGCGIGAFHTIFAARKRQLDLRLVNIEQNPDAVRCAEIIAVCHGISVENVCLDMMAALERPDDLVRLERLFEDEGVILVTHGALHPLYSDDQYRALFDFAVNDLPTVGGVHREPLGFRTPLYSEILRVLSVPPQIPPALTQTPSDPFKVLEDGSLNIRVVDRQEIAPHFLRGDFPSYLGWERSRQ
ncbi:MAG: hypothetical protein ACYCZX_07030 [Rhodospirillaceae bacterium]